MPDCEIISIGTELLLGQILNTNAQFLSSELAAIGVNCFFQTTVGDNKGRIIDCLRQALNRAQIILITGGLGPTADDLTTECVAQTFGASLVFDEQVMLRIESFFKQRSYPMPESNRKQAFRPGGSQILPNPLGTAPGIIWVLEEEQLRQAEICHPEQTRIIMTFPGVPAEMQNMWQETAKPFLSRYFDQSMLWSCDLKHYGIGESALAEKYAHLLEMSNPTVAPYAGHGECKLRVTARGANLEQAKQLAREVIDEIRTNSGRLCYGVDHDTLESVVGGLLKERKLFIAVAESCTGGLVSKRLTDIAGSSAYTSLNAVTYSNAVKERILGVDQRLLALEGAVNEQCAQQMASGIRELAHSDIGLAITGIAGPGGGTQDKSVGLVYIALESATAKQVKKLTFPQHLSRSEIRHRSASEALNMVRLWLLGSSDTNEPV